MKNVSIVFLFLTLSLTVGFAQQTDCPRIYKAGDTLKTDPAPTYQWYKNGVLIPNANNIWYRPDTSGNYTVAVSGTSAPKSITINPADLRVEVFDAKLKPVANATVSVNGQSSTTNAEGKAFLPNAMSSGRTVIKVTANGYFDGYTATYKPASGNAIAKIQLERMPAAFTVVDTVGGGVASSAGLHIRFKPNAFINESTGELYSGEVKVYFNHRTPENDPMFGFAMPGGDFTALNANGELVAFTSYGFFNAELRGTNGEALNLKPGTTAEVQFRIPENMRANAPATTPLWYFDETAGIWKYESELNRNGMFYKGQVSHFSRWNCDVPGPLCTVVVSAVNCAGNPAANAIACLNQRCGHTDANGNITFANAPAGLPVSLYTFQDTLNIGIVGQSNTYTLSTPLQARENVLALAQYWQDSVQIYTWGTEPPVQYSLDNQNWQTEPLFTNVPFQDSIKVWVKDASSCSIQRNVYYNPDRMPYLCNSIQDPNEIPYYRFGFNNLPTGNIPVYQLLGGCPENNNHLAYICARYVCLAELWASGCGMTSLPAEIGNLDNLKMLRLSNNSLTGLPAEIGNLSNLETLLLSGNQLTSLPAEIGNLSNLKGLHLENNQFTGLPAEIGNLSNLKGLYLENNQLTSLPAEIGNLSNLERLYSPKNPLTSLPAEIGNLSNLKYLLLSNNQLTSLPAEITNLANTLQNLYLQGNPIPVQDRAYYQSLLPNTTIIW